jgi:hypothetical protein
MSDAKIEITRPVKDPANLEFVGADPVQAVATAGVMMAMSSRSSAPLAEEIPSFIKKKSWRDLVDQHLLADSEAVAAFEGKRMGKARLVKRTDAANSDYYLVPFGRYEYDVFLVSGVIILDARDGYFKEASWTGEPERFLETGEKRALLLIKNNALKDLIKELRAIPRKPEKTYASRVSKALLRYTTLLRNMNNAKAVLVWAPDAYSPSPYKPYWQITAGSYVWYVTQDEEIEKK